jgi:hypothetical protein
LCWRFFFGERELGLPGIKERDREIFILPSIGVTIKSAGGPFTPLRRVAVGLLALTA